MMDFSEMVKKQRNINKRKNTDLISMSVSDRNELMRHLGDIDYYFIDLGYADKDERLQTILNLAREVMEDLSYYNGTHEEDYGY